MDNEDLLQRVNNLISCFELVFDIDWEFTKQLILDEDFISNDGTFLDPRPGKHFTGGRGDNWTNRTNLLSAYRELRAFAISEGLYDPDDEPWND